MKKSVRERVIEQPCCGCILFRECGSIVNSIPFKCDKRMTVEEFGHIPTYEEIEDYKNNLGDIK